jgi:hypothetical protein
MKKFAAQKASRPPDRIFTPSEVDGNIHARRMHADGAGTLRRHSGFISAMKQSATHD